MTKEQLKRMPTSVRRARRNALQARRNSNSNFDEMDALELLLLIEIFTEDINEIVEQPGFHGHNDSDDYGQGSSYSDSSSSSDSSYDDSSSYDSGSDSSSSD